MLTGGQFYDVLCAVVPLYVALFLGYASLKWWGVVTPEQSTGLSRFNALVAMPPLVFQIIAFNDPYTMNNRLIAAYSLSNAVVLAVLCAWAKFAKSGSFDWAITLFQLTVMSNTIIVGIPVLSPLYSVTGQGIAAIFIGQVLWLFVILFLYELRDAWSETVVQPISVENVEAPEIAGGENQTGYNDTLETSRISASRSGADASRSGEDGLPALITNAEHRECCIKISAIPDTSIANVGVGGEGEQVGYGNLQRKSAAVPLQETNARNVKLENCPHTLPVTMNVKQVAFRVVKAMLQLPLTYSTFLGIIYSLIASRWNLGPPRILSDSLDIIGRIVLGLTMYTIGLFMASEKKLLSSWWVSLYGAFFRFVVGPAAMGLASYILGIRGDTLRFSILQAALPQAVISFVFAKQYNLHINVFSTAVSLQTLVFMPIVLAYYTVAGLI